MTIIQLNFEKKYINDTSCINIYEAFIGLIKENMIDIYIEVEESTTYYCMDSVCFLVPMFARRFCTQMRFNCCLIFLL